MIPEAPLDILAQQIVAACAADEWADDDLFALVRRAYPYRALPRSDFDAVVRMLSEGIAARRGRYGAYLYHDAVNRRLKARRGARLAAITSGGAIPESALYAVVAEPEGVTVGTVDEDFAVESLTGDIMLLGNTSWRIRRVSQGRVIVEDAHGAAPNIPFWNGEAPSRTIELSEHVAEVRSRIDDMLAPPDGAGAGAAIAWLTEECGLDRAGAEQAVDYVANARRVLGVVPTQQTIVAERFFDEGGGMQLVIHAPFGGRINKAWGLALRKRFCRSFNFELQAAATDNGLNISLAEQHSFPLADVFHFLHPASVREVLEQAVLPAPVFGARWRWDASRSLALLRFRGGKRVPLHIQRLQSDDLLASVFPDAAACPENLSGDIEIPDHPLIREVMKDVLTEAMDLAGLQDLLTRIRAGAIRCVAVDTPAPSVFSHEILNANPYAYLDDAPLEERRARAVEMRRTLPESVLNEVGRLDPAAIAEVTHDAWPDVRDPDELHDALQSLVLLPDERAAAWGDWLAALVAGRRAVRARANERTYWVASERAFVARQLFPTVAFEPAPPPLESPELSREQAMFTILQGWLAHTGPVTEGELAAALGLSREDVESALLRLEASGAILRGVFKGDAASGPGSTERQWCDRRLLARIHRLTLGRLRREIAPVPAAQFMGWLLRWQHVAPDSRAAGEHGTTEVLRQLQGFEAPANAWEPQILARRIAGYDPKTLDALCLSGIVGWGRLSPHPAMLEDQVRTGRRVIPTSVAPITFFVRGEAGWMALRAGAVSADDGNGLPGLSAAARDVAAFLGRSGASFFTDIVRGTHRLKAEVETALWELVASGVVTADGFDNLRALLDPRRRAGHGSGRTTRPRHSAGRWTLLHRHDESTGSDDVPEAACRMLLQRYGVVFREVLARESILPRWRDLLVAFRRLEDRGEVRGGRFVSGLVGEQFALPIAVESLRAFRHARTTGETVVVSAADPLNLVGILVPGERVSATSGRFVSFRDGVAVEAEARAGHTTRAAS